MTTTPPAVPAAVQGDSLAQTPTELTIMDEGERKLEKKLLRRIDFTIMPLVILLFLLNYIDRTNYAAARLQGLEQDLSLDDTQYQVGLSIFFVGYITAQVPSNIALNYSSRPSLYLGLCVIAWGLVTTCTSQVKSYGALVACRLILGITEAPFVPGVLFYLSKWYTRRELNLRMSTYYSGSLISGAFGNLIAAGILQGLNGKRGMAAWQWLYIVEGTVTILAGIAIMLILPDFPHSWKRLSEDERRIATHRLLLDAAETDVDEEGAMTQIQGLKLALLDPKTYVMMAMHVCMIGTISFQNFFPTLTSTLTNDHIRTLLLAAPPYLFITVASWIHSYFADRMSTRFWFYMYPIPITIVGFALFMGTDSFAARYFSLFLVVFAFNQFGTFYSWIASSIPRPPAKRAAAIAFINAVGNSSSIWTTFLYTKESAPFYRPAFGMCLGLQVAAAALAITLRFILTRQNNEIERLGGLSSHGDGRVGMTAQIEGVDVEMVKDLKKNYRYLI